MNLFITYNYLDFVSIVFLLEMLEEMNVWVKLCFYTSMKENMFQCQKQDRAVKKNTQEILLFKEKNVLKARKDSKEKKYIYNISWGTLQWKNQFQKHERVVKRKKIQENCVSIISFEVPCIDWITDTSWALKRKKNTGELCIYNIFWGSLYWLDYRHFQGIKEKKKYRRIVYL